MSNKLATKADLQEMYSRILPYLGGTADAGFTPVGTIIPMMSNHAPVNYLACDGTVYNIADYPELANHFLVEFGSKNYFGGNGTSTFAVPDLRGEFLRGTGVNGHANQGAGAAVGVHQDSTAVKSEFQLNANTDTGLYIGHLDKNSNAEKILTNTDGAYGSASTTTYTTDVFQRSNQIDRTDGRKTYDTIRPTNTSVLYCIATKNIYLNPSLDYSTDEKVVGHWIDGKPLYQKTIVPASQILLPNKTVVYIQTGIGANVIDKVVSSEAYCRDTTDGWYRELPKIQDNNANMNVTYQVNVGSGNLDVFGRNADNTSSEFSHATLRYTKRSD